MSRKGLMKAGLVLAGAMLAGSAQAQAITPGANPNAPSPGSFTPPAQARSAQAPVAVTQSVVAQPAAAGQPKAIKAEAERKGRTGTDIFLGTYLTLSADCKIGADPKIEFLTQPKNGTTKTRTHPINLRDVPGAPKRTCIGVSPKGVAAVYRSNPRFKGQDDMVFKVSYPNGDSREVTMKVNVQ